MKSRLKIWWVRDPHALLNYSNIKVVNQIVDIDNIKYYILELNKKPRLRLYEIKLAYQYYKFKAQNKYYWVNANNLHREFGCCSIPKYIRMNKPLKFVIQ